jgi:hypothetical protein
MKINFKKALGIGASILTVAASILAIFGDKDDFADFLKNATDDELDAEREKVRLDYCNPDLDEEYRISCQNKLRAFDNEMSKRAWGDEKPHGPSIHREHGWYLPNDD